MGLTLISGKNDTLTARDYPEVVEAPRFTCALGGAYACALATYGAVPILHSSPGCGMANAHGMTYASGLNSGGPGGTTVTPCSALIEEHVVFGGEDKLRRLIESTISVMKGQLFVVISGCVPALIGDDVDSVVSEFKDKAKVIHVKTSGVIGNAYLGYNHFFDTVIESLLTPQTVEKKLVNILGLVPNQNVFWKGDLINLKDLLAKIGVKTNTIFSDFDSVGALERIPAASLNLVLSPWVGLEAAKKLEERFGTPFEQFEAAPVGPKASAHFLRTIANRLKIPKSKVEAVIKQEENAVYQYTEYLAEMFMISMPHAYLAVIGDSGTVSSFIRYGANELGWNPKLAIVTDNPPEELRQDIEAKITDKLEGIFVPRVIFDFDSYRIRQTLREQPLQVILASSLEKYIAGTENEAHHLSVSYPLYDRLIVERSYVGFRGGLRLIEDMSANFAGPL
ncbi:MAG: nitrogenase [Deltaproteobacteria bacterium]|jgi:nitrogenase molybdenum-iron protein beta chain|nr:nitrogenase [Deltaproteobacteria bacterium]